MMELFSACCVIESAFSLSETLYKSEFDSLTYLEAKHGVRQLLMGMAPSTIVPKDLFFRTANIVYGSANLVAGCVSALYFSNGLSFAYGALTGCIEGAMYVAVENRIISLLKS